LIRIFGAPHRYYQGPGAFEKLADIVAPFGDRPLVVADAFVLDMLGERLRAMMAARGLTAETRAFAGEITYAAIGALKDSLDGFVPGIVVGIGGGKSLDAAKGVATMLSLPMVTVPTIASNDSPTSGAYAVYDDNHVMIAVDRMHRSPEAVIVDTALIAKAPARFLRAGIGDAISKKFEADGCIAGTGITPFGTRPGLTAIAIADACYRTLRQHAKGALAAVERGEPDEHLEAAVEATVLMSGLGFENGGLSLAHSLTRGLVKARGAKDAIHGDHVAWGLLVQLAAEGRPDEELLELMAFYREIGLPTDLEALGMNEPTDNDRRDIARHTMTAPHLANLGVPVTEDSVATAIERSERLARKAA
jgi:glycerol dehydrogenase